MPVKKDSQKTHMVVFMEIAEQMNGSQAVDSKGKGEETTCWKGTSNSDNETVSTAVLAKLSFNISPWQVYCYEDFTLTNLASGFFGNIYKVCFRPTDFTFYFCKLFLSTSALLF